MGTQHQQQQRQIIHGHHSPRYSVHSARSSVQMALPDAGAAGAWPPSPMSAARQSPPQSPRASSPRVSLIALPRGNSTSSLDTVQRMSVDSTGHRVSVDSQGQRISIDSGRQRVESFASQSNWSAVTASWNSSKPSQPSRAQQPVVSPHSPSPQHARTPTQQGNAATVLRSGAVVARTGSAPQRSASPGFASKPLAWNAIAEQ